MSFLSLRGVGKRYGAVRAVDGVDLDVAEGGRTAIVGPSGSGKTTLLRLIAGFEAPDAGRVVLGGEVLADGGTSVPAWRREVGVVMQDGALFPHLSIAGNIGFGLARTEPGRAARIAALMQMVELDPAMLGRRPDALSGGQQQRVALARALARQPRLMLLDEPFSALDTGLRASTRKAVAGLLGQAGITTILVTHDQSEALSFADQVVVMAEGRVLQAGAPQEVYWRPASALVASFLGEAVILPAALGDGVAECALGRVAVAGAARGAGLVMLRPEQIRLGAEGVRAEVMEVDFGGAVCTVSLRVAGGERLVVRQAGQGVPAPGEWVGVGVAGLAHVLGGSAREDGPGN